MKYYIIAGEASGDLHASNLLKEIRLKDPDAVFRGFGGDLMKTAGTELVMHYRDLAFMGFVEVLMHLRTILRNLDKCKADIEEWKPDVVILVDYPGFNLRIAPHVKSLGIPVIYYISPQIWAWKQSRVHKIIASTDKVLCILPFEKDFYAKFGYGVEFCGHPLLDAINQPMQSLALNDDGRKIIAILPGSRKQEIKSMLPVMLKAAESFPQYRFVIAGAPSQPESFYREVMNGAKCEIVFGQTYPLLKNAYAAMVTSGTATLETALFNVPEVVCYKGSSVSYAIAKQLVKVKYISLVNLIMDQVTVTELIQDEMNATRLVQELKRIAEEGESRNTMLEHYSVLQSKLGGSGASKRAAELILKTIR
jgi:lipid-A-disaccharide synthase